MKLALRGDRAIGAIPVSLAARISAWAKESLVARAMAIAAGLVVLAVIGGSALAGNGAPPGTSAPPPTPLTWVDAGGVAVASRVAPPQVTDVALVPETAASASATMGAGTSAKGRRASPDDPVDLNAATTDDLRRLPGIGAKRAEAILALRARLPGARFRQIEDLLKVKGIGRAMLRRLHPLVRITTEGADGGAARA